MKKLILWLKAWWASVKEQYRVKEGVQAGDKDAFEYGLTFWTHYVFTVAMTTCTVGLMIGIVLSVFDRQEAWFVLAAGLTLVCFGAVLKIFAGEK